MTSQSPRIYTYKITFEEVPYYYYGVKREKYFNEEYWGSPITNKWCWDFYTPKKQILELFECSDEGWAEAQEVEKRLIRPVFNTDKLCLNKNCGGYISLEILKENGRRNASKNKEKKIGIFALTSDEIIKNASKGGKIGGKINAENKTGVCGRTKEKIIEDGRKGGKISGKINYKLKKGIHALSFEQRSEVSKRNRDMNIGMFKLTEEQKTKSRKKGGKSVSSQKWMCTETGHITNAGALATYQKKRGIDTKNRVRLL